MWPCPAGMSPNMCPWAVLAQSHCLLFSFIPSNSNGPKQCGCVLRQYFLLVLASVLYLVSEALTIFGASAAWEGQLGARASLNPWISCAVLCHLWTPLGVTFLNQTADPGTCQRLFYCFRDDLLSGASRFLVGGLVKTFSHFSGCWGLEPTHCRSLKAPSTDVWSLHMFRSRLGFMGLIRVHVHWFYVAPCTGSRGERSTGAPSPAPSWINI